MNATWYPVADGLMYCSDEARTCGIPVADGLIYFSDLRAMIRFVGLLVLITALVIALCLRIIERFVPSLKRYILDPWGVPVIVACYAYFRLALRAPLVAALLYLAAIGAETWLRAVYLMGNPEFERGEGQTLFVRFSKAPGLDDLLMSVVKGEVKGEVKGVAKGVAKEE